MVNELPLRWATHYTSLATHGSRLQNNSVLLYDVWRNEGTRGPGGVLLAVAIKSAILLYEAPKGERAFRFSKVILCLVSSSSTRSFCCKRFFRHRNFTRPRPRAVSHSSNNLSKTTCLAAPRTSSRAPHPSTTVPRDTPASSL